MVKLRIIIVVLISLFLKTGVSCNQGNGIPGGIRTGTDELIKRLRANPDVCFMQLPVDSGFTAQFRIDFRQPLDHFSAESDSFFQQIILAHRAFDSTNVLITEGYSLRENYCRELSDLLGANEIRTEHRFFGDSAPDSINWKFLNIRQAAADYHRILSFFRTLYPNSWISTGWSKGGQTAMIHRSFYPQDVRASVSYDSPLNFALEEERIDAFFDTVGTEYDRERIIGFQRKILQNKTSVLPRFEWYSKGRRTTYSIGYEKALEYIVLEYPFSFWQYTQMTGEDIPLETSSPDTLLEHLRKTVSFRVYSDAAMNDAGMHQFSTELGYYGYVKKNLRELLSSDAYPNWIYAPSGNADAYDSKPMRELQAWLEKNGDRFIYIYGNRDPWSATGVEPGAGRDALLKKLNDGNHFTLIKSFPENVQQEIMEKLKGWLNK